LILAIIVVAGLLIAFRIGMFVGFRKATYSFHWSDNYHQMFAGPRRGFFDDFEGKGFTDAYGIFGSVMKIENNDIVIRDKDATEKTVVTSSATMIRKGRQTIQTSDLTTDDDVVVIGEPDAQGRIDAKFIRVFPRPFPRH